MACWLNTFRLEAPIYNYKSIFKRLLRNYQIDRTAITCYQISIISIRFNFFPFVPKLVWDFPTLQGIGTLKKVLSISLSACLSLYKSIPPFLACLVFDTSYSTIYQTLTWVTRILSGDGTPSLPPPTDSSSSSSSSSPSTRLLFNAGESDLVKQVHFKIRSQHCTAKKTTVEKLFRV